VTLIALGTVAALLICTIALDHLLRRLLTGALMPGRGDGFVDVTASLVLTRPPIGS
jgi:hypothetical protein